MDSTWHKGVVVGVDGSPESLAALDWAASAADRHQAQLTVLSMYETARDPMPGVQAELKDLLVAAEQALHRAEGRLGGTRPGGHAVEFATAPSTAARVLVQRSRTADLVVVGRRGLGRVGRALLGSVSSAVVTQAHGPVVVVPFEAGTGVPRRIVAGVDMPEEADHILERAFAEAEVCGCRLDVMRALDVSLLGDALREYETSGMAQRAATQEALAQDVRKWAEKFPAVSVELAVRGGPAASVLVHDVTPEDLLVVGGKRHNRVTGRLLGSVTDQVVREAGCPVMVVRAA
ncbi:universal stress protein [Myceligenerans xiligouense]|uniref:Nucleotide-binding universal stress UspA family protein n=1 Tax=Myceligenerans xiligouense TaxID=253184 RepID=A0A3N4YHR0_9MICO|nr:universal stress protein [Myceligenerans xiligouense]RPF19647.1 nucleotide-binding universal stress UspA family protein [Myceligenerans xiligouense]